MKKIGLTGGIASGKSLVANVFEKLKVPVYFADNRAGELINTHEGVIAGLKSLLGEDIYVDGKADKQKLTGYIFSNPELKKKMNELIHPVVMNDWAAWCRQKENRYVVMESALLFQTGYFREMDVMLVTEAGVNMRAERLVKRDRIAHAEAIARIQSQEFNIPDKVKIPVYYIRNNNNHEMLLSQVVQFHELMIL